jgi:hypothetical protein
MLFLFNQVIPSLHIALQINKGYKENSNQNWEHSLSLN